MNSNKELWNKERKIHNLKYPDENVIRFLYKNYSNKKNIKILDFGCGSGRNTVVMAELKMDIIAMDYNEGCLLLTEEKLKNYKNIVYLQNEEFTIPLEDNSVDSIVAWGALFCHNRLNEEKLLKELYRVLKKDGLLLSDYRTKEDSLYGRGERLEEDFFRLDDSCGALAGITYAFRTVEELGELYERCGMSIVDYEKKSHFTNKCTVCSSHYILCSRKEV